MGEMNYNRQVSSGGGTGVLDFNVSGISNLYTGKSVSASRASTSSGTTSSSLDLSAFLTDNIDETVTQEKIAEKKETEKEEGENEVKLVSEILKTSFKELEKKLNSSDTNEKQNTGKEVTVKNIDAVFGMTDENVVTILQEEKEDDIEERSGLTKEVKKYLEKEKYANGNFDTYVYNEDGKSKIQFTHKGTKNIMKNNKEEDLVLELYVPCNLKLIEFIRTHGGILSVFQDNKKIEEAAEAAFEGGNDEFKKKFFKGNEFAVENFVNKESLDRIKSSIEDLKGREAVGGKVELNSLPPSPSPSPSIN